MALFYCAVPALLGSTQPGFGHFLSQLSTYSTSSTLATLPDSLWNLVSATKHSHLQQPNMLCFLTLHPFTVTQVKRSQHRLYQIKIVGLILVLDAPYSSSEWTQKTYQGQGSINFILLRAQWSLV